MVQRKWSPCLFAKLFCGFTKGGALSLPQFEQRVKRKTTFA